MALEHQSKVDESIEKDKNAREEIYRKANETIEKDAMDLAANAKLQIEVEAQRIADEALQVEKERLETEASQKV